MEGRAEATVALEYSDPGSLHQFRVRALKGRVYSLDSSEVWLIVPGEPIAAPSDVSATVDPNLNEVEVRWTDNSDNESAFDVQFLEDGEPIQRKRMGPDDERASFRWSDLEPRIGAEYGVRVYAFNSSGYSEGAETSFRWEHPLDDGVVTDLAASAIGPTTVRVTWTADPEVDFYRVRAKLAGWSHSVRWYPSSGARGGAAWVDIEDLPRGGRYRFEVQPSDGRSSSVYLTLGERAAGPEAPSDVSLAIAADRRARLSWKDNSSDETGFEIQYSPRSASWWTRLVTVPPDTESVVLSEHLPVRDIERYVFRVFAYNERGFSAASPFVAAFPGFCQTDAETLCLRDSRFEVKLWWRTADGERGRGQAVDAGAKDSGLFHFFDPENWEALFKVLDGCSINGRMWVLAASTTDLGYSIRVTDTLTGEWQRYWNEPGQPAPAIVDVKAFSRACGAAAAAGAPSSETVGSGAPVWLAANAEASAVGAAERLAERSEAGGTALHLLNRRFRATVSAVAPDGNRREGRVAPVGTDKAGLFYLFDSENWEVLFKVLDGCGINGHYWVLAASATDLGLDLRVEDTVTGKFETYGTAPGKPAPAIVDTEALACAAGAVAH